MKQRERIEEMEKHFERASKVVARLSSTLEEFARVQGGIDALEAYYGSQEWKRTSAMMRKACFLQTLNAVCCQKMASGIFLKKYKN